MDRHFHGLTNKPPRFTKSATTTIPHTIAPPQTLHSCHSPTIHYKANLVLPTKLQKIRRHANIKGNGLADKAAKMDVTSFEDIPEHQKLTITIENKRKNPNIGHVHQQLYHSSNLTRHRSALSITTPPVVDHPQRRNMFHASLHQYL